MTASERGQAFPIAILVGLLLLGAGAVVFTLGRAHAAKAAAQVDADVTAVSAARALRRSLPAMAGVHDEPARERWRDDLRRAARRIARRNGADLVRLTFPDSARWPPTAVRVLVSVPGPAGTRLRAASQAAVQPGVGSLPEGWADGAGGEYRGPLVTRDGRPMCPAVARAFDRMDAAARLAGVDLVVNSGFRSDAEQAVLFARHPDPKWVARPGTSRHRNATELDIDGAGGAWAWLSDNATGFGFVQRYAWEPWHYGYVAGCGEAQAPGDAGGTGNVPTLPEWVPMAYRDLVDRSARTGGVPPILLAALLQTESGFDPAAVSAAGALGIAQFMPDTARGVGLADPFDPTQAIPAAARLLGGHLRQFGSIPLALAAYNAGPGAVRRFGGIPPYDETRAYVARILAIAGDPTFVDPGGGDDVTLVRIDDHLV